MESMKNGRVLHSFNTVRTPTAPLNMISARQGITLRRSDPIKTMIAATINTT